MENNNFECNVNKYQTSEIAIAKEFSLELQDSINQIINKDGYLTYEINTRKITTNGNNLIGDLYEVNISGNTSAGPKATNLFLKHIIPNEKFKVFSIPEVYAKEAFFYKELWKIYEQFQEDAEISYDERFKTVKSYEESNNMVIILENMTNKGYKVTPKLDIMSIEFAELSVKQLAKFHGLSFVVQSRNPEYFENKIKTIKQPCVFNDFWVEAVKKLCEISTGRMNNAMKEKITKFFPVSLEKYPKYVNGLHSEIKCLVHGDYKMNNILLKETHGHMSDVIAIDFQQSYYGCPVIDLIYFIYAASDRDFRKQYSHHLRDLYFQTLTSFLNYFDIDLNFSKEDFEKCFTDSLDYGLIYTLYFLPMFFIDEELPHLIGDESLQMSFKINEIFYDRMQGIVDEFIEMGVL